MSQASRDQNRVTTLLGVSSVDGSTPTTVYADPVTHRLLVDMSGGASGITTLNGQTGATQTFADVDDTNVTLTISSALDVHTFTMGWQSTLAVVRGGTGTGVAGIGAFNNITGLSAAGTTGTTSTNLVFSTSPALTTPNIGAATATSINVNTITAGTGTLTLSTFTLTVAGNASVSGTNTGDQTNISGNAATVTVADAGGDTTMFPLLGTDATGSLSPRTDAELTYNATTNALTTTTFIGALTGNASTVTGFTPAGGSLTLSGANALTLTTGGATNVTLPTTGTLATLAGTEELTNKTLNASVGKGTWTASGTWTLPAVTTGGLVTMAANIQMGENTEILLDASLSADGKYCGITEAGTAGTTLAFGDSVYLAVADSRWELTDADADATAGAVKIGVCVLAAAADGDPTKILLYGKIRADANFPTFTVGAPVYLSTTTGDYQVAQPSGTDDVIRIVGYGNTGDELDFRPSNDYMTHT